MLLAYRVVGAGGRLAGRWSWSWLDENHCKSRGRAAPRETTHQTPTFESENRRTYTRHTQDEARRPPYHWRSQGTDGQGIVLDTIDIVSPLRSALNAVHSCIILFGACRQRRSCPRPSLDFKRDSTIQRPSQTVLPSQITPIPNASPLAQAGLTRHLRKIQASLKVPVETQWHSTWESKQIGATIEMLSPVLFAIRIMPSLYCA